MFLITFISVLVKMAVQLSSQSCPMDNNEDPVILGYTVAVFAGIETCAIFKVASWEDFIISCVGNCTSLGVVVCLTFSIPNLCISF